MRTDAAGDVALPTVWFPLDPRDTSATAAPVR